MPRTVGFEISSSPTSPTLSREQVTTLNTPFGMPASSRTSAINRPPATGVSSDGFSTIALPTASATAEAARRQDQREIPRRDHRHDAERLANDEAQLAVIGREDLAVDLIRGRAPRRGTRRRCSPSRTSSCRSRRRLRRSAPPENPSCASSSTSAAFDSNARAFRVRQRGPSGLRCCGGRDGSRGVGAARIRDLRSRLRRSRGCTPETARLVLAATH